MKWNISWIFFIIISLHIFEIRELNFAVCALLADTLSALYNFQNFQNPVTYYHEVVSRHTNQTELRLDLCDLIISLSLKSRLQPTERPNAYWRTDYDRLFTQFLLNWTYIRKDTFKVIYFH